MKGGGPFWVKRETDEEEERVESQRKRIRCPEVLGDRSCDQSVL